MLATATVEAPPALVVGIGASAGGLDALERLFAQMPQSTGCGFVVVQHLARDSHSRLGELIGRTTTVPVVTAQDGTPVRRDHIYVAPNGKHLRLQGGRLRLVERTAEEKRACAVDEFFASLAADCGARAVAVVLSGTGSDGSHGLRAVHEAGGRVLAQTPESAAFDGMPQSATDTGMVDTSLAPEEIADALLDLLGSTALRGADRAEATTFEGAMTNIVRLLRETYGIDFASYKPATIVRRAQRRAVLANVASLPAYAARLLRDAKELDALYKDLLIGVTRFFRDPSAFERLGREIISAMVRTAAPSEELRIWVAGCATGEEAYSVAILLKEAMEAQGRTVPAKIFATDVHQDSLRKASIGLYPENAMAGVSPERRARFFTPREQNFQVCQELRDMVVFAPHNVLRDAPFTNIDLICCRNLLIYFEPQAQRKVLSLFHYGLKVHGCLLLGGSETTGELSEEFEAVDTHFKIFRKRRDVRLAPGLRFASGARVAQLRATSAESPAPVSNADPYLMGAYDALLDEMLPPSLLVGPRRQLSHTFGGAGRFLSLPSGRITSDVAEMLEGDLRVAVVGALQRVFVEHTKVVYRGMRAVVQGEERVLDVTARPLRNRRTGELLALLTLEDTNVDALREPADEVRLAQAEREHVSSLEIELKYTRENLRATIEEVETSNEELQAANEELVAANEQLQSTNEELHSVNEELHSVNSQLQSKVAELLEVNTDLDHLQASTEVHTLFVDEHLCIRKFTPKIGEKFNLLPQDVGRSIEIFTHTIDRPSLVDDIRRVASGSPGFEDHVRDSSGRWFLMRILPYRRGGGGVSGAVLTLIDVTELKCAESDARRAVVERDRFLATLSHELRNPLAAIQNANRMLARTEVRADAREWENIIGDGTKHMVRLLDDLLDVARVTQGKMALHRETLDLRCLVRTALEAVAERSRDKQIQLSYEPWQTPLVVEGDSARLGQVLSNLLVNAVRYTPSGGRVSLLLGVEGGSAVLRVKDTGIGIPPEMLERVFEPFVQGHGIGSQGREGGMGVGLSVVRHIVELHEGEVTALSQGTGCGSEFVVRLPLSDRTVTPCPLTPSSIIPAGLRILLVEDDLHSRRGLSALLELDDMLVTEAASGEEAVALFARVQPSVVLLDLGLPGMDGFETCRALRALPGGAAAKIVALTGFGQESDREATREAGFDAHITKPIELDDVYATLNSLQGAKSSP
jgi:chemotaxis methyl-accepting protein methylase/signal transduction histidine kinase/chemotaxis response regulator CheB